MSHSCGHFSSATYASSSEDDVTRGTLSAHDWLLVLHSGCRTVSFVAWKPTYGPGCHRIGPALSDQMPSERRPRRALPTHRAPARLDVHEDGLFIDRAFGLCAAGHRPSFARACCRRSLQVSRHNAPPCGWSAFEVCLPRSSVPHQHRGPLQVIVVYWGGAFGISSGLAQEPEERGQKFTGADGGPKVLTGGIPPCRTTAWGF